MTDIPKEKNGLTKRKQDRHTSRKKHTEKLRADS